MLIFYDDTTGKILCTSYGQDETWTEEMVNNHTRDTGHGLEYCVKIPDEVTTVDKYFNTDTGLLEDDTKFSITKDKESVISNETDIVTFSGVPEETIIVIDGDEENSSIMDNTNIFSMSCIDSGTYIILFKKKGYDWWATEVRAVWN